MTAPMKNGGFAQGIYQVSSTEKEAVGTCRALKNGDKFVMAKAGSSALSAGKMGVAAAIASTVMNQTCAEAIAVGSKKFELTIGSSTYAEDYFRGGKLQFNDVAPEGHQYTIVRSSAVTAGTSIYIEISDPIQIAATTTSQFTLAHNPWMATVESATEENLAIGVPSVAVPAEYYYWAQVSGHAICLISGTTAANSMLTLGATAGALTAINATLDTDQAIIGRIWGTAGVATEYKPVILNIC